MGQRRAKTTRFIAQHPHCCFCGGETPSVEIDHLPSRSCFDDKNFPDGFEFPTCRACNASTSEDEQVVALFARMLSNPEAVAIPKEIGKYMSGVANNSIGVFDEMARAYQGKLGADNHLFEIGDETLQAFTSVLTRWAKAFHYKESGVIVPADAHVVTRLFTNANIQEIPPEAVEGKVHELRRSGKNIEDQFAYITRNDPDRPDLGYYTAAFRRSFLAIMLVDFTGEMKRASKSV